MVKINGKCIRYFEGRINKEYVYMTEFLKEIKGDIAGELPQITFTEDKLNRMLAKLEERRRAKGEI